MIMGSNLEYGHHFIVIVVVGYLLKLYSYEKTLEVINHWVSIIP
jgi:hypothetical protein